MTILEAYEKFIHSKIVSGLSENTIDDYHYMLIGFRRFVGNSTAVSALTQDMVDSYIMGLYNRGITKATASSYIRNLRIFLTYIDNVEPLSFAPETIIVPKSPKKRLRIYGDAEILQIFQAVDAPFPWLTARNRAIISLMLDSGIRQGEVCSLLWSDIDFTSKRMKVHGKGDKERFVALGDFSASLLHQYLELCPYPISDHVFLESDGSVLTGNAVRLFMYRLAKKLPFELSSHRLRHNFATNWCLDKLESGSQIDALTLQILMGHESIVTTQGYIHCAFELMAVKSSVSHLDKISALLSDIQKARNPQFS